MFRILNISVETFTIEHAHDKVTIKMWIGSEQSMTKLYSKTKQRITDQTNICVVCVPGLGLPLSLFCLWMISDSPSLIDRAHQTFCVS